MWTLPWPMFMALNPKPEALLCFKGHAGKGATCTVWPYKRNARCFIWGFYNWKSKLFTQDINCVPGVDPCLQTETRLPGPLMAAATPKPQKSRATNSRDERFRSGRFVALEVRE